MNPIRRRDRPPGGRGGASVPALYEVLEDPLEALFGREETLRRGDWTPPMDISETPEEYTVVVEVPGIEPEEIDVTLEDNVLHIRGEKRPQRDVNERDYYRLERRYGPFERAVRIPANIDGDRIAATAREGLLRVALPKLPEARPRRIAVAAGAEKVEAERVVSG